MTAVPRIIAVGDNVVDCYRSLDTMFPGGNCVNVSVFARRFGAETAYLGAVGDDVAGRHIAAALRSEGVDLSLLRTISGGTTAWCLVGHTDGDRVFLGHDPGVSVFVPADADLTAISGADAVHVGASSSLDAWVPEFGARTRLSYDFTTGRDRDHIRAVAPHTFLATFSGSDLTGQDAARLQRFAVEQGAEWVLVTWGDRGALLARGEERWAVPATPVRVVDTLGSGDTFVARTLVGLLRGEHPDELLAASASAAATTCTTASAFGYPAAINIHVTH